MTSATAYIKLVDVTPAGRKTQVLEVWNIRHNDLLGTICWHGPWRHYVYAPAGPSIYSTGCLQQIQAWIDQASRNH